jgi:hypothetical protein
MWESNFCTKGASQQRLCEGALNEGTTKMKKILTIATLLASTASFADGFRCQALDEPLSVKVFNNTQPELGTRTGAVMIVSDLSVNAGRKTIAVFRDGSETLGSKGATYTSKVDLRFNDSGRKGELIAGTKLGQIKTIVVDVDHQYNMPTVSGAEHDATMTIVKRNGEEIALDLTCERYLKN